MFVWNVEDVIGLGVLALMVIASLCGAIFLFIGSIYFKIKKLFKKKESINDKMEQ